MRRFKLVRHPGDNLWPEIVEATHYVVHNCGAVTFKGWVEGARRNWEETQILTLAAGQWTTITEEAQDAKQLPSTNS